MKKILLYVIGIIGIIVIVGVVSSFLLAVINMRREGIPIGGNKTLSTYDTAKSYAVDENGKVVVSSLASSRIDLKINGSDQPFITKAPFSFTVSWKIDPAINLSDCRMDGPNIREGYYDTEWPGVLKSNEGSLKFENVVPGDYQTAPLYNGVASFYYQAEDGNRNNFISINCDTSAGYETKNVVIIIDR